MQLLCPNIPLLFMGEERLSRTPFLYFTDHHGAFADAVREGRRREFASFASFASEDMPDPNASATFERSRPRTTGAADFYRELLGLRRELIVPRLPGTRAVDGAVLGSAAISVRWRMGDGAVLSIAANLGKESCPLILPAGERVFPFQRDVIAGGILNGSSTVVFLEPAP